MQKVICQAIKNRWVLSVVYEHTTWILEPHVLAFDRDGNLVLSAWTILGDRVQGWSHFSVSRLSSLAIVEGRSEAPREGYQMRDTLFDRVVCQV